MGRLSVLHLALLLAVPEVFSVGAIRLPRQTSAWQNSSSAATSSPGIPLQNVQNIDYLVNISLSGQSYSVIVDTGSTDLWISETISMAQDTGKTVDDGFGLGPVNGNVVTASMAFGGYQWTQAFVNNNTKSPINPAGTEYAGVLGLGLSISSDVQKTIGVATGSPVMDNIFAQNKTSQNYITFLLGRAESWANSIVSQMTISEIVPGYEAITQQTKLPLVRLSNEQLQSGSVQHWMTYTDAAGIIGPDGKVISVQSTFGGFNNGSLVAAFATGWTLPQVPSAVAQAMYGWIPGATYSPSGMWTVPCSEQTNITFVFGGQKIFIPAADAIMNDGQAQVGNNSMCTGSFQPFMAGSEYDIILGMSFLRNVYTLLNYGDFVSEMSNDRSDPYIQLLAINNSTSTGGAGLATGHLSSGAIHQGWPYLLAVGLVIAALLAGFAVYWLRRRGQARQQKKQGMAIWPALRSYGNIKGEAYRDLSQPAPQAMGGETHEMGHAHDADDLERAGLTRGYHDPFKSSQDSLVG